MDKADEGLLDLDKKIKNWRNAILGVSALLAGSYASWFSYHQIPLSLSSGDWGTLGDFLGGILNPLIAFSAFYWLTKSVRLQKEELASTRSTLEEASNAQKAQVKLAALTALISSIMTEVTALDTELAYLCTQFDNAEPNGVLNLQGKWMSVDSARELIAKINARVAERLLERSTYEDQIKLMLRFL